MNTHSPVDKQRKATVETRDYKNLEDRNPKITFSTDYVEKIFELTVLLLYERIKIDLPHLQGCGFSS